MLFPSGSTIAQALKAELSQNPFTLQRFETLLNEPDARAEYSLEELFDSLKPESLGDFAEFLGTLVKRGFFARCYRVVTPGALLQEYGSLGDVPTSLTVHGAMRAMHVDDLKILYRRLQA